MKYLQVIVACVLVLFLPGCWDYRKINDRAQVIGIGVDPVEGNPSVLRYTFQVPNLESSSPSGGSSGGGPGGTSGAGQASGEGGSYKNFTVVSAGLQSALSQAQTEFNKGFYFGNLETIILNSRLTQTDVQRTTEQLMRDETVDKVAVIAFTKEAAENILSVPTQTPPASVIESAVSTSMPQKGFVPRVHLWEFWRDAEILGVEPRTNLVTVHKENIKLGGTEILKGYAPVGDFSANDDLFYNFMVRRNRHISITIPDGDRSFEVTLSRSSSDISVTMKQGVATLHDDIRANGVLGSREDRGTRPISDEELRRYERVIGEYIETQSTRLLHNVQGTGADIFGFGRWYVMRNPDQMHFVQTKWQQVFSQAVPDIHVSVRISRTGSLI